MIFYCFLVTTTDAVVALAEYIAGTEDNFVKMMNSKVQELGLSDTNFKNCHGLDEEGHYSSAYDMAMIGRALLDHEKILDYTSIYETYLREDTDRKIWLVNTNNLVRFKTGVDGLKTGYTKTAGYCLTATMKKENMRVIATVMGEDSIENRNSEVSSMLDYSFSQYKMEKYISKNKTLKKIYNNKTKNEVIEIVPYDDVNILTRVIDEINSSYEIKIDNIKTNIKKGDKVGEIIVKNNGKVVSRMNLTVKNDVKKANLFELYIKYLKDIASGNMTL